jgi:hypothetical protein
VFESKNEIDALKRTIKEQRSEIDALKKAQQDAESIHNSSQNDLEQYGRRNSVRISGLANDSDQQTSMVVADETISLLSKKLGLKLESKDVDVAHRLGKYTPNKNRPVIVKFVRRQTKIDIMQRAKLLKGTGVNKDQCGSSIIIASKRTRVGREGLVPRRKIVRSIPRTRPQRVCVL